MYKDNDDTMLFKISQDNESKITDILRNVYASLEEKGYEPKNQLIGYILSGDPSYITSHKDARKQIRQIDRNDLLEELLTYYLKKHMIG